MRIALTRPEGQNEELAARLRELGHEVVVCPLIAIEPLGSEPIDVSDYDWLIVSSPNGSRQIAERARGRPKRVAAIGEATAAALPWPVDLVPSVSTQEGLLAEMPRDGGRVLVAAAAGARPLLVEELRADFLPLYRTRELRPESFPEVDLVVLASGSAARAFAALDIVVPTVSIGPVTSAVADELDIAVLAEAPTQDVAGLVSAVEEASRRKIRGKRSWQLGPLLYLSFHDRSWGLYISVGHGRKLLIEGYRLWPTGLSFER